ncbi:hypothetical protein C8J57DRAFT_1495128 [Mycena rebaudengoi]|nr:hypothetical protein C8J57DRAFT_1495128 [Mycena rebaudengoi]
MSSLRSELGAALQLKNAITLAPKCLAAIGECKLRAYKWAYSKLDGDGYFDSEEDHEKIEMRTSVGPDEKTVKALVEVRNAHERTVARGTLKSLFGLQVTRKGCEHTDLFDSESEKKLLLKRWYDNGVISGYGDVKKQTTDIDPQVRHAREIPASEFEKVRAEAYKIHLYGPGGKFLDHRDTPETNMVGTFLVGLGDTCSFDYHRKWGNRDGALQVKQRKTWLGHKATLGSWIAFYPDVPHAVREIRSGYRAVIAFKLFSDAGERAEEKDSQADVITRGKIRELLEELKMPCGMLLGHLYGVGSDERIGFDNLLVAAAKETIADVKILPVVIGWGASYETQGERSISACARIFPLTHRHVRVLRDEKYERADKRVIIKVDLEGTEDEWITHLNKHTPFHTLDFENSDFEDAATIWKENIVESAEHVGNESRPYQEDSVYVTHALILLPPRGTKRKAPQIQEESSDSCQPRSRRRG